MLPVKMMMLSKLSALIPHIERGRLALPTVSHLDVSDRNISVEENFLCPSVPPVTRYT